MPHSTAPHVYITYTTNHSPISYTHSTYYIYTVYISHTGIQHTYHIHYSCNKLSWHTYHIHTTCKQYTHIIHVPNIYTIHTLNIYHITHTAHAHTPCVPHMDTYIVLIPHKSHAPTTYTMYYYASELMTSFDGSWSRLTGVPIKLVSTGTSQDEEMGLCIYNPVWTM